MEAPHWCQWEHICLIASKDKADDRNHLKCPINRALLEAEHPWELCMEACEGECLPVLLEQWEPSAVTTPGSPVLSLDTSTPLTSS